MLLISRTRSVTDDPPVLKVGGKHGVAGRGRGRPRGRPKRRF